MSISDKIRPLDALRGLGAVGIGIFFHYRNLVELSEVPFYKVFYFLYMHGFVLVEFFFILSGIVFSFFYYDKIMKKQVGLYEFAVARISRLWPLQLLTLIIVALIQWYRVKVSLPPYASSLNDLYAFILNFFMIQSWNIYLPNYSFNTPAWALSVEIFLYILFFFLASRKKLNSLTCAILICIGVSLTKEEFGSYLFMNQWIGRGITSFFWGIILSRLIVFIINNNKEKLVARISFITLVFYTSFAFIMGPGEVAGGGYICMVYNMMVFPAMIFIAIFQKQCRKILLITPLQGLGKISFTIYMVHFPIQALLYTISDYININFASHTIWAAYSLSVIVSAVFIYRYFELPAKKYIRRKLV